MALFGRKNKDEEYDEEAMLSSTSVDFDDDDDDFDSSLHNDEEVDDIYYEDDGEEEKRNLLIPGILTILLVAAIVFGGWFFFTRDDGDSDPTVSPTETTTSDSSTSPSTTTNSSPVDESDTVTISESVGNTHTGIENGSQSNGTSAIMGYQYQYYVARSGEGAMSYFDPTNMEYDATYVQEYIDQVPEGTRYLMDVTPVVIGSQYQVRLYLQLPGMQPVFYNQEFEMMEMNGKYYVKQFTSSEMATSEENL